MPTERPPGHTCPSIDEAQSLFRRLAWRARKELREQAVRDLLERGFPEVPPGVWTREIAELVKKGQKALEDVRAENVQMRTAYHAMQKERPHPHELLDEVIALLEDVIPGKGSLDEVQWRVGEMKKRWPAP